MSIPYYPVFLDIRDRAATVVGGGTVAEGKVTGLLEAGARVTVVSPALSPGLTMLAEDGAVAWVARNYRDGDLADAWLAVAATDDPAINMGVAEEAARRRILANVVDRPAACSFIAPAVIRRDDLTIAISTHGKSPAVAHRVREEVEQLFPAEWGELLKLAGEVRQTLKERGLKAPPGLWQQALSPEVLDLVRQGKTREAADALMLVLLPDAPKAPRR